ncbi:hypothetical protein Tco_1482564 [Tanacetum coccineum]
MAALESCPKHNMVAYLEKTDVNAKFHEIIDFFTRNSIHYALTGKNISGNVTLLFPSMLLNQQRMKVKFQKDHLKPNPHLLLLTQKPLVGLMEVTIQAKQIQDLKAQIKKLKKKAKHVISHHNAWIKSVSMKKRLARKKSLKTKLMQKESVSKQGRKPANLNQHKEARVSTEDPVSTDKTKVSTDKLKVSTDKPNEGTADGNSNESAAPTTVFRDDENIAQFLVQEEWKQKKEKKSFKRREEKSSQLNREPTSFMDNIAAQRKFLAITYELLKSDVETLQENQLRKYKWMTYLKHVGGKKHSDLKNKKFEEIQVLYEKIKSSDENFIAIGSTKDEKIIRELNKKAASTKKADSIKEESKEEAGTRKRKLGTRKKMKSRKRRFRQNTSENDSEKENDELKLCLTNCSMMRTKKWIMNYLTWNKDNTMALELIRFVKKLIAELEPENSDGDVKDLLVGYLKPHNKWS